MVGKARLAREAIHLEQHRLKEHQDQVLAAFGGFNRVDFTADDAFQVTPVVMWPERLAALEQSLLLFFTGFSRNASDVARTQVDLTAHRGGELKRIYELWTRLRAARFHDVRPEIFTLGSAMGDTASMTLRPASTASPSTSPTCCRRPWDWSRPC
jgi:galactokinase/mevalonate kinase-like predicted kinase